MKDDGAIMVVSAGEEPRPLWESRAVKEGSRDPCGLPLPWAACWPGMEGRQPSPRLPQVKKPGGAFCRLGTWSRIFSAGDWAVLEGVVAAAVSSPIA